MVRTYEQSARIAMATTFITDHTVLMAANHAPFQVPLNETDSQTFTPIMEFLTPLIGWGYMAAILAWSQDHQQPEQHWLVKAGKDSFGAYLIHIPLLAGTMITSYSLGEETSGCLD